MSRRRLDTSFSPFFASPRFYHAIPTIPAGPTLNQFPEPSPCSPLKCKILPNSITPSV